MKIKRIICVCLIMLSAFLPLISYGGEDTYNCSNNGIVLNSKSPLAPCTGGNIYSPCTGDKNAIMILAGIMGGTVLVVAVAVILVKKNKK